MDLDIAELLCPVARGDGNTLRSAEARLIKMRGAGADAEGLRSVNELGDLAIPSCIR
jgi:hypothetical protein